MLTARTISKPKSTDGRAVHRLIPYKIGLMLGIDQSCSIDAKRTMGGEAEAVIILRVLEKANAISTSSSADTNGALQPMLMALANREIVS